DGDLLRIADGVRSEYVRVDGAPAGNVVTLASPTAFAHVDATPVRLCDAATLEGALTLAVGDAPAGTHLVAVADGSDAATADAVGFGPAPDAFLSLGQALVVQLATALGRNALAGGEAASA